MFKKILIIILVITCTINVACTRSQQKKKFTSPPGYDLNKPVKYAMPEGLLEISGITFNQGNTSTIYAEQDEEGKMFYFHLGDKKVSHTKFGKHGDYEDIAILNNNVIMLKSNGTFFIFPLAEATKPEIEDTKELANLLPAGEYESMYAGLTDHKLYVLAKRSGDAKSKKESPGYIFDMMPDGSLKPTSNFELNIKAIDKLTGLNKIKLRPSAFTKNPLTGQWYILSSVNKLLVVTDKNYNVVAAYKLDPAIFLQPEGITFDKDGNLYISNEGDEFTRGNVLLFRLTK